VNEVAEQWSSIESVAVLSSGYIVDLE